MKSKLSFPFLILLSIIIIIAEVNAETDSLTQKKLSAVATVKLIEGIHSDVRGISRCCIYLAGKYKIREALKPLISRLKEEQDPAQSILIAIVLYKIGDPRGIYEVDKLALRDSDHHVRKVCKAIYDEYLASLGLN